MQDYYCLCHTTQHRSGQVFTNWYLITHRLTFCGTHKLKKKINSYRATDINSCSVLCICYVTVFCSLLKEKNSCNPQRIHRKEQKGDHLDTIYIYMYARGPVPKINDLIIKSKQLISKQIIIRHQN